MVAYIGGSEVVTLAGWATFLHGASREALGIVKIADQDNSSTVGAVTTARHWTATSAAVRQRAVIRGCNVIGRRGRR